MERYYNITITEKRRPGNSSRAASPGAPGKRKNPKGQGRLMGLDFLRAFLMLLVIIGHVTSTYLDAESGVSFLGMNLAFFLNQSGRFSVPLFILLSGFSLELRAKEESYLSFLKGRAIHILPPYVAWLLLYELSNCGFDLKAWLVRLGDLPWLCKDFLTGQAAPHLYFIPIIFQCYLLYPLLKGWVRRAPLESAAWAMAVTFLLQSTYVLQGLGFLPAFQGPYLWMTFPLWCFYFVAGMCLQKVDFSWLRAICRRNVVALALVTGAFGCLHSAISKYTGLLHAVKPELMLFALVFFFWGIGTWELIGGWAFLRKTVSFLSRHSMGIYYNHVMVLCFLRQFSRFQQGMSGMLLLLLATSCLSLAVAVGLSLVRRAATFLLGRCFQKICHIV